MAGEAADNENAEKTDSPKAAAATAETKKDK